MSQESAVLGDIAKAKKNNVVLGLDPENETQEKKLSQEEVQELKDLYHRIESHSSEEVEEFKKKYADFFKEYSTTEEDIEKLSFFINKLDKQERKFFIETLRKMPMTDDGFSIVPGLHKFESALILYNKLKETGRINEDIY